MDIINRLRLFLESEVYRSQGLYVEAKNKHTELVKLILHNDQLKNKKELIAAWSKRMKDLEIEARKFEEDGASTQMSRKNQDLVKKLFSSSEEEGSDAAELEGAKALFVFGQLESALSEFNKLIKRDAVRVDAAKNIIRCHIGLSSLDNAVTQYQQWSSNGQFPSEDLEKIRSFLQDNLNKRGIYKHLPKPKETTNVTSHAVEEDVIDILSVKIPLDVESQKGKVIKLDVSFQKGIILNIIIPNTSRALISNLKVGLKLNDVQFYSAAVIFKGSCLVSAKKQIKSGPKKGDYILVMKILNL